eukprot:4645371-Amphidinium_carterae.1
MDCGEGEEEGSNFEDLQELSTRGEEPTTHQTDHKAKEETKWREYVWVLGSLILERVLLFRPRMEQQQGQPQMQSHQAKDSPTISQLPLGRPRRPAGKPFGVARRPPYTPLNHRQLVVVQREKLGAFPR